MDLSGAFSAMWADLPAILSMLIIGFAGLVAVLMEAFQNKDPRIPWLTGGAFGLAMVWELTQLGSAPDTAFFEQVRTGGYAAYINLLILGAGFFTALVSPAYLRRMNRNFGEVYALLLFATVGMIMLGTANTLISVFVGLETMSICLYILAGLLREDEGGIESALKYFLLGAFSTGFLLYGIALMYGTTGTMYLPEMAGAFPDGATPLFWAGVGLVLVGFGFKVSAAPFHMWTPDVYQGAPTPLTGYMSTASKASAFAALILVLFFAMPSDQASLVLAVLALMTMAVGNIMALRQANVKRMLAYSSIAHAGYIFVALASGTTAGYSGALFYLLVYTVMNLGAFGVLAALEWDGKAGREQTLSSLAGMGLKRPILGASMAVFMFSLIGFPPFGGFIGKYYIFAPAVSAGLTWLVIIGLLFSAMSGYYYLRVIYVFYMQTSDDIASTEQAPEGAFAQPVLTSTAAIATCAVLLLVLGVAFSGVVDVTEMLFVQTDAMAQTP